MKKFGTATTNCTKQILNISPKTDKHIRSRNFRGESINVWLEYFTNANITIDTFEREIEVPPMLNNVRVKYAKLDSTAKECNDYFKQLGVKFDFIIDDGLHTILDGQRKTFENLIEFTDTYYIEDVWNQIR